MLQGCVWRQGLVVLLPEIVVACACDDFSVFFVHKRCARLGYVQRLRGGLWLGKFESWRVVYFGADHNIRHSADDVIAFVCAVYVKIVTKFELNHLQLIAMRESL